MSNRKTTFFYALLIAIASLAVGMVIASRLGLSPESSAQTLAAPPINSAPITGPLTATTFRDIAKNVTPAVVNIRTEQTAAAQDLSDFFGGDQDLFDRFFGQPQGGGGQGQGGQGGQGQRQQPRNRTVQAAGTGFIIDKAGFILTNNHVVENATKIMVSLYGEDTDQEYAARVVGRDPLTDSALIELTDKPNHTLPEVKFGDSSQMLPGDWVMAIGNPFGLGHTVSVGIVSANRPSGSSGSLPVANGRYADVIQTDAAINPGNSGGPLLNMRGEVIGINTAIISDSQRSGNVGIGFAIPSNVVRDLLPQLRVGKITRGRIGVNIGAITAEAVDEFGLKDRNGAVVISTVPDSAAEKAGLEPGDVILTFNGKAVRNRDELVAMVTATRPGTTVPMGIVRDKQNRTLNITVDELDIEAENTPRNNAPGGGRNDNAPQTETNTSFGLTLGNITPQISQQLELPRTVTGAVIRDVEDDSPAARAGLRAGDVITRIGNQRISSAADATRLLGAVPARGTALMRVWRDGSEVFLQVTRE